MPKLHPFLHYLMVAKNGHIKNKKMDFQHSALVLLTEGAKTLVSAILENL